ncbi:MAG: FG-GAP-like repeat-containing protein [Methylacidiphilales bacterium]|nr:FG-GAP-like repeat-containing protein [Candidatus Methylacidiphilales bacterium]
MILVSARQVKGQNLLAAANAYDYGQIVDNRWGGVNNSVLTVLPGLQKAVNDAGAIVQSNPGPSVAIGDLNGDGLPDLVVGDARGFFWFFPNKGTPTQPKFTYGEVMPIWIGAPRNSSYQSYIRWPDENGDNTVPRICLVDFDKGGKLGIVAGNYEGKLFYIHNDGSAQQPKFRMPQDLSQFLVPTYSQGKLWCNFLAPCLYDWWGNGLLDLIMGEGTYASNSIYLLTNKGTNQNPVFNEDNMIKLIPNVTRDRLKAVGEHLTPQVVDWNNDGKPDIITGERLGYIDVYLNTTTDPLHPQFDQGQHVLFGGTDNLGQFTTVAVGDLTGNKLPNLLISNSSNQLSYATNHGTLGNPLFNKPVPIQGGVNPLPKIKPATNWTIWKAEGIPYVNLVSTNQQIEPGFEPPAPEFKSALKYYTESHAFNTDFPDQFYPQDDTQIIQYNPSVSLKPRTRYTLSFWVKTVGDLSNFNYILLSNEIGPTGWHAIDIVKPISSSGSWTQFSDSVYFELRPDTTPSPTYAFQFKIAFNGHPTLYFDGFSLTEDTH